jgi:uncharacterized protein (DUF779 family)
MTKGFFLRVPKPLGMDAVFSACVFGDGCCDTFPLTMWKTHGACSEHDLPVVFYNDVNIYSGVPQYVYWHFCKNSNRISFGLNGYME